MWRIIIAIFILILSSCSTRKRVALIGTWQDDVDSLAYEFNPDGTGYVDEIGIEGDELRWEIIKPGVIKITEGMDLNFESEYPNLDLGYMMSYKILGDTILIFDDTIYFKRIRKM